MREHAAEIKTAVNELATREERERAGYEVNYRKAILGALDYVEILGLDIERARREATLSIAYLSLTTSITGFGRIDYETILDVLPPLGNRLLIEGAAGSGKSTLLRWTAVEAARFDKHRDAYYLHPRGGDVSATLASVRRNVVSSLIKLIEETKLTSAIKNNPFLQRMGDMRSLPRGAVHELLQGPTFGLVEDTRDLVYFARERQERFSWSLAPKNALSNPFAPSTGGLSKAG